MQKVIRVILLSSVVFGAAVTGQAQQLPLPGKTLKAPAPNRAGIDQPAKNVKNVLGLVTSPVCPYIDKDLRELLNYARVESPNLYRQALSLRRAGFTQEQVRVFLYTSLCEAEGFMP